MSHSARSRTDRRLAAVAAVLLLACRSSTPAPAVASGAAAAPDPATGTAAAGVRAAGVTAAAPAAPNIVVILADDMGYSDIGAYGGEIPTPNIDRLAAEGVRFRQFYNNTRCSPTRAALLTGVYPHQAGMGHMPDNYAARVRGIFASPAYTDHLSRTTPTIAEVLRGAGYVSYMSGKWHLGYTRPDWPADRGFARSFVVLEGAMNYYGRGMQHTGEVTRPPMANGEQGFVPPADGFFATDAFADSAVRYVREHRGDAPFFLYLAFTAPHWPLHAPAADVARFRGRYGIGWDSLRAMRHRRLVDLGLVDARWPMAPRPEQVPAWDSVGEEARDRWDLEMAVYAAQMERMDAGIGRLLRTLEERGMRENTLVVFLSDNGGAAENPNRSLPGAVTGERESFRGYGIRGAHVSSAPFRLTKKFTHEGGIATPAIVRWPARIPAGGAVTQEVGHVIDLLPTFAAAAGATFPAEHGGARTTPPEGVSLLPALAGGTLAERTLYWEHEGNRAVRQGRWKLVSRYPDGWELYDLEADGTESRDLAASRPERVRELAALYDAWTRRAGVESWARTDTSAAARQPGASRPGAHQ